MYLYLFENNSDLDIYIFKVKDIILVKSILLVLEGTKWNEDSENQKPPM